MTTAEQELMYSVQALAQPAKAQLALLPDFVCPGDELVLTFDDAFKGLSDTSRLGEKQKLTLRHLDSYLETHSGEAWGHLYLEAVGLSRPEWEVIRGLARDVLDAFDWPDVPPPRERGQVYVSGDRVES